MSISKIISAVAIVAAATLGSVSTASAGYWGHGWHGGYHGGGYYRHWGPRAFFYPRPYVGPRAVWPGYIYSPRGYYRSF